MCMICDNPEGNMCRRCESDMAEVRRQSVYPDDWTSLRQPPQVTPISHSVRRDNWWPAMAARSINVASGEDAFAAM